MHANGAVAPYYMNNENFRGVDYLKYLDTYVQKLNNTHQIMGLNRMKPVFTLRVPPTIICIKPWRVHGTEGTSQHFGKRDHPF